MREKFKNNWHIFLCLVMFILGICVSLYVRSTYVDNLDQSVYINNNQYKYNTGYVDWNNDYIPTSSIGSIDDLIKYSDCMLKIVVEPDAKRYYHSAYTVTEAKVVNDYNIDDTNISGKIYILEPVFVGYIDAGIVSWGGYYWMQPGGEYIVFLRQYKDMHIGGDKYIYAFTSTQYSKYPLSNDDGIKYDKRLKEEKYEKIMEQIINYANVHVGVVEADALAASTMNISE